MPLEESLYPQDWFAKAQQDLLAVEALIKNDLLSEIAGFHLQQAIEKYLKGYLLSQGWQLRRIHNLEVLLNEAVQFEPSLEEFRELCEAATDFYTLERYPFFASPGITTKEIASLLPQLQALIKFIDGSV